MIKKKIFMIDESPLLPGKFLIRPSCEDFYIKNFKGSLNILGARLLNISYANYLRLCRDSFGAEIIGKGSKYPVPYFKRSKELTALVDLLNARANLVLWNMEHPDHDKHAAVVKEKNPDYYAEVTNG